MSKTLQDERTFRVKRTLSLLLIFTIGSLWALGGDFSPHGNPLLYAIAMSWLITIAVVVLTSAILKNAKLFSLAHWEKDGEVYAWTGVRAFRWVLLHSPLGWMNPDLRLSASRTDCDRLLREMNASEGVHWLTCFASVALAISYLVDGFAVYGYDMLLVRIPWDLYPIMLQRWNRGRVCRVLNRRRPGAPIVASP